MLRFEQNADRPVLIWAYVDSGHAARYGRYFRRQGWDVRLVASAAEARRLTGILTPRAIVLDTELPDESGWLACAKLTHEDPGRNVILLAPSRSGQAEGNTTAVRATALVTRADSLQVLAEAILGARLAEAV
jgi:DNA-binding response OmpR family regulator